MVSFRNRSLPNTARKNRRIQKYGKYSRPLTSRRVALRGSRGRFVSSRTPVYHSPFSQNSELVQMKYTDTISLSPTSTDAPATYQFSLNSIYDPDVSSTGHQPMYYDNFAQLWNKYNVRYAKMKITVIDHQVNTAVWNGTAVAAQNSAAYKIGIIRDETGSDVPSTMNSLIEQNSRNVIWRFVSPSLNGSLPSLSLKCAPHKVAGAGLDDDIIVSAFGTSPQRNIKAIICVTPADPLAVVAPPTCKIYVELVYYVKLFDRITAQSAN